MKSYVTMTPGGLYGSTFTARNDDEAMLKAAAMGYKPAEVVDDRHEGLVVVVED